MAGKRSTARGFTLMEMMVAVGILVVVIMAIGYIFKSTSAAVGLSQVSSEMFSNVRAVQYQLERDLAGIDRNGFLVIRSRYDTTTGRRSDQICFLANGTFANKTGGLPQPTGSGYFGDQTVANSAVVWYGQGIVGSASQSMGVTPADLPTGSADKDFVLCRHASLLLAQPVGVPFYTNVTYGTTAVAPPEGGSSANIASSRICTVALTPGQLMQTLMQNKTALGTQGLKYVAENYCYRFRALPNAYANSTESGLTLPLVNAVFRMHPILMPGTPSFAVEWTDGSMDGIGQLRWYGLATPKTTAVPTGSPIIEAQPQPASGDDYTAVFLPDSRGIWPKALKITYRVTDVDGRLQGGREFVQVVKLPS